MHLRASALEYRMRAVRFACAGCRGRSPDLRLEVAGGIGEFEFAQHHAGLGAVAHAEAVRSEEHTSELQSLMRISYAVFCLKKKKNKNIHTHEYRPLRISL